MISEKNVTAICHIALIATRLRTLTPGLWIGGERGTEGAFQWVNNDPFEYSNWANSYPDTNLEVNCICCFQISAAICNPRPQKLSDQQKVL